MNVCKVVEFNAQRGERESPMNEEKLSTAPAVIDPLLEKSYKWREYCRRLYEVRKEAWRLRALALEAILDGIPADVCGERSRAELRQLIFPWGSTPACCPWCHDGDRNREEPCPVCSKRNPRI